MPNHPNRKPTPFIVKAYPGDIIAKCPTEMNAQMIAKLWSNLWLSWVEVYNTKKGEEGIVGQYVDGAPTQEFIHLDKIPGLRLKVGVIYD